MKIYKKDYLWYIYKTEKYWRYQQPNLYNYLGYVEENNILTLDYPTYLYARKMLISKILNKSYNDNIWREHGNI